MADIKKLLEESGALLNGHFKLTSGRHSDQYVEKIKLINQPEKVEILCGELTEKLKNVDCDIVVGPAMGGIVLAYEVAKKLGKKFVFTQRKNGKMSIRSGFEINPDDKAIIIEDIVTTGGSVKEVIQALEDRKVKVEAVGLIVDRSGGEADFGIPTYSLLTLNIDNWLPEECPLCKKGTSITSPGRSDKK